MYLAIRLVTFLTGDLFGMVSEQSDPLPRVSGDLQRLIGDKVLVTAAESPGSGPKCLFLHRFELEQGVWHENVPFLGVCVIFLNKTRAFLGAQHESVFRTCFFRDHFDTGLRLRWQMACNHLAMMVHPSDFRTQALTAIHFHDLKKTCFHPNFFHRDPLGEMVPPI